MNNIKTFKDYKNLKELATAAAAEFYGKINSSLEKTSIEEDEHGVSVSLNASKMFELKKISNEKIEVIPYSIIIEGNFILPIAGVVPFFREIGKIYWNEVFNIRSVKGTKPHDWSSAKDKMEEMVQIYSSEKLINVANKTGVFD